MLWTMIFVQTLSAQIHHRAPGMARILPVKDWSQVSIAKRSERQAGDSNVMGGGSHVAKL